MQLAHFNRILQRIVELFLYMRGEDGVHKSNPRYAEYIKRQNRARDRRRSKKIKHQKRGYRLYALSNQHMPVLDSTSGKADNQSVYVSKPPANFSIINNSDEVIDYFSTLIEFLKINTNARCLRFDFSAVREMTIDALMYLMAIIKFIRKEFCKVEEFSGNIPVAKEAKELFLKSGFSQLMSSSSLPVTPDESVIRICYDSSTNSKKTKDICDFVISHAGVERKNTMFLYNMLMELEVNANEHAYNEESKGRFKKKWLVFVEDIGPSFRFTFLDIGVGIYSTIHRKLHEKLFKQSEYACVISAFEGIVLRSETKMSHRGRGLPKIKEFFDTRRIEDLRVVTNKAYCYGDRTTNTSTLLGKQLKRSFIGTLYYWEIAKQSLKEG